MDTCVSNLGYVGIEVSDLRAWTQFATEVLGMAEAGATGDGGCYLRMDEKHHRATLHPGSRDDLIYAGWEAPTEHVLGAIASRLTAQGRRVTWLQEQEARARGVARAFRATDPMGIDNEVFHRLRDVEPPFRSPRPLGGFVTGALGMGHIVLFADDVDDCLGFYRDGLGLKMSDTIDVDLGSSEAARVSFLHAGPRHHALALVPLASPKRLHHLMLQVAGLDDVGITYDLCRDREVPIASTLGCHTNDRMTSFYMQSPAGFQVEYGHGGIEIDDDHWEIAHYDRPSIWGHRSSS